MQKFRPKDHGPEEKVREEALSPNGSGTVPYRRQRRSVNAGSPRHASDEDLKVRGFCA
jgi:hypothetical protein